jgi:hypothetical protein
MTSTPTSQDDQNVAELPKLRVTGPAELLAAVPYLIGFHPAESLVLVGIEASRVVVTARLDLRDATDMRGFVDDTLMTMRNGGASLVLAVVYDDSATPPPRLLDELVLAASLADCELLDILCVAAGRWWSLTCEDEACCPADGRPLGDSRLAAEATFAGLSALPDRATLHATLHPDPEREALRPQLLRALDTQEIDAVAAEFSAAHDALRDVVSQATTRAVLTVEQVVRFGVALCDIDIRDRIWVYVDAQERRSEALWRELARRLPPTYDVAPLFLLGWSAFRSGNGALANIACERCLLSDPDYGAAKLLLSALSRGVDPRQLPKLQIPA